METIIKRNNNQFSLKRGRISVETRLAYLEGDQLYVIEKFKVLLEY